MIASLELASALGLREIVGFTRPANLASRAVLLKTGFRFVGYVHDLERDRYICRPKGASSPSST